MTDLFANKQDDEVVIDESKNYLEELVGEGKKFKDPSALARGKAESDAYIVTLTKRMDDLRKDYLTMREDSVARASLDELLQELKAEKLATQNNQSEKPEQQPSLDQNAIKSLISDTLKTTRAEEKAEANYSKVEQTLKQKYGSNYGTMLKEQADMLGLTSEDVNSLARKSPEAFFRTMGLNETKEETFQAPPRGSTRTDSFTPKGQTKKTWSYYQNLKKDNPKLYLDPKTAVEMNASYTALGKEFEDGDFHSN